MIKYAETQQVRLGALITVTKRSISKKLIKIFKMFSQHCPSKIDKETKLSEEVLMSSFDFVYVLSEIEREFGIDIKNIEEYYEAEIFGDIVNLVESSINQ